MEDKMFSSVVNKWLLFPGGLGRCPVDLLREMPLTISFSSGSLACWWRFQPFIQISVAELLLASVTKHT